MHQIENIRRTCHKGSWVGLIGILPENAGMFCAKLIARRSLRSSESSLIFESSPTRAPMAQSSPRSSLVPAFMGGRLQRWAFEASLVQIQDKMSGAHTFACYASSYIRTRCLMGVGLIFPKRTSDARVAERCCRYFRACSHGPRSVVHRCERCYLLCSCTTVEI